MAVHLPNTRSREGVFLEKIYASTDENDVICILTDMDICSIPNYKYIFTTSDIERIVGEEDEMCDCHQCTSSEGDPYFDHLSLYNVSFRDMLKDYELEDLYVKSELSFWLEDQSPNKEVESMFRCWPLSERITKIARTKYEKS